MTRVPILIYHEKAKIAPARGLPCEDRSWAEGPVPATRRSMFLYNYEAIINSTVDPEWDKFTARGLVKSFERPGWHL
jgi:hypothetical protein